MPPHGPSTADIIRVAFPSVVSGEKCLAVFAYYADESGTHAGSAACAVAAYLSHPDAWLAFEAHWKQCLKDFSIPQFHMSEFENRQGPFVGWEQAKRIDLIDRLVTIINTFTAGGVAFAVDMRQFNEEWVPSLTAQEREVADPYLVCALALLGEHAYWMEQLDKHERSPAAFVFELNGKSAGRLMKFFGDVVKHGQATNVPSITHASRVDFVPLQAADILAYESYKALVNRCDGSGRPQRKLLTRLRENNRIMGNVITLDILKDVTRRGRLWSRK